MSDHDRPREEMRTASDLWPRRQRSEAEERTPAVEADLATQLQDQPPVPPSGASDLRPSPRAETPLRRTARPGVSVNDVPQSSDLRPGRSVDTPLRREPRGEAAVSRDLQERVERIQQATGQPVGERRPPVTGIKSLTKPAYTPPPYSPPRPSIPSRPADAPADTPADQSTRPPLGSHPVGNPPPQGPSDRPSQEADRGADRNGHPERPADANRQQQMGSRPVAPWQEQPGAGQRPIVGPDPAAPPWRAGSPPGQYQQPWSGQQAPPPAPNWGSPAPPLAPWQGQGQGQGQPPAPYGQPPWTGAPPAPAPWQPGYGQPGQWQPGYGQQWVAAPGAQPVAPPARVAGSGQAPWGLREIALIVVGGLVLMLGLSILAIGLLEGAGFDTTDELDPAVFLALGSTMYVGFGAAIWAVLIAWRKRTWADLGFRHTRVSSILCMIPLAFGVLVIVSIVGLAQDWLFGISPPEDSGLPLEEGNLNAGSILAVALVAVVLAPLFEELFFRGVLFQYLRSRYLLVARGLFEAVVISALAFASLHLGGAILPILPVGVILALVMHRTNSLWPPIALHVFYNGLVLAISLATLS